MCAGVDSNHRRINPTRLQRVLVDRLSTDAFGTLASIAFFEKLAKYSEIGYDIATMAKQENLVKMVHKATGHMYWTRKNRRKLAAVKLKLKKYNPVLRKVVEYTEGKK